MTKRLLVILILTFFLLTACSGQSQEPVTEAPEQEEESQPAEVASTEEQPTEAVSAEKEPTQPPVSEPSDRVSTTDLQMECTLVSDQPDAPAEFVEIFGIKEDDWVTGPENAAVTFVEYGDFQ